MNQMKQKADAQAYDIRLMKVKSELQPFMCTRELGLKYTFDNFQTDFDFMVE